MSLLGVHAGFAAAITTVVVAHSGFARRWRWAAIFGSAIWAIVPDLYHLIPGTRAWYKPVVHDSTLANVFWFHRMIDRLDPRDRPLYSVTVLAVFLFVFSVTEIWIYHNSGRHKTS